MAEPGIKQPPHTLTARRRGSPQLAGWRQHAFRDEKATNWEGGFRLFGFRLFNDASESVGHFFFERRVITSCGTG
jgi:hypothetical protein